MVAQREMPMSQFSGSALLGADVEGQRLRPQAQPVRLEEQFDGAFRFAAAELAADRPLRAGGLDRDAADQRGAGRGVGDLSELLGAVEREQRDAAPPGVLDRSVLLHGVAEGEQPRVGSGREAHVDLAGTGDVEAAAEPGEQPQQFGRGARLHRVVHLGVGQRLAQGPVLFGDHVEVEQQAGGLQVVRSEVRVVARVAGHRV